MSTDDPSQLRNTYQNPLNTRYASAEMSFIFSDNNRYSTWRFLWLVLAKAQQSVGLDYITNDMLQEMQQNLNNVDYHKVALEESKCRHDVMAHLHVFGQQCPSAYKIMHLGATSCYITDNCELILMKKAIDMITIKAVHLMGKMKTFCKEYKQIPTLGFTHLQPAQLTTVGKRACLWLQDVLMDVENFVRFKQNQLKFRGVKGTTGTQASFLTLFNGDREKVTKLDQLVTQLSGFDPTNNRFIVTGQTYTRKLDVELLNMFSSFAATAHKIATDLRLLANFKEIEEPFEKLQAGSSAMAYKRNPMRSERICSLSRYLASLSHNAINTHSTQWLERTLDDSANRRIVISESFLTADSILIILNNVFSGLVVYEKMIHKRIMEELPFMATENIIMKMVALGNNRQECHEKIRVLSQQAAHNVKTEGKPNDLIERIKGDKYFKPIIPYIEEILDPKTFIGCAPEQVAEFIETQVDPLLENLSNEYLPDDNNNYEAKLKV